MRAKTVIPAVFMGLGAFTAWYIYASTQVNEAGNYVASIREVPAEKATPVKEPAKQTPAAKDQAAKDQIAAMIEKKKPEPVKTAALEEKIPPPEKKPEPEKKVVPDQQPAPEKKTETEIKPEKGDAKKAQASLDEALKPVLEKKYSEADIKVFNKAYELMLKDRFTQAKPVIKTVSEPLIKKTLEWYVVKSNPDDLSIEKLREFWKKNSDWPHVDALKTAAESQLLSASDREIREYLRENEPVSSAGLIARASILIKDGKKDEGIKIIRGVWRKGGLSQSLDKIIIDRFGKHLSKQDHHIRAQRYLYEGKASYVASALSVAKSLDAAVRKILDVHIAIVRRSKQASKKVLALSDKEKLEPNIIFARVQRFRQKKQYKEAWDLLKHAPDDPELLVDPDAWWKEKRRLILEALNLKEYQVAYDIAKKHGQSSVEEVLDAEFLAGWIAYRFLKKPAIGYEHFVALRKAADGPRSTSRSEYWMGRTALELGRKEQAREHFRNSAKFFNTFYGQLAKQSLAPKDRQLEIASPDEPTAEDIRRFQGRDAVRAIVLAHQAKQDALAAKFLGTLRYEITQPGEMILLAELAKQLGHTQQSVRIGKTAMFRGFNAAEYAYPVHAIPEFKPLGKLPEKAFTFAIARQESEFNTKIKSHVGASGLMQVMPATAKLITRKHKIKYSKDKLFDDPGYNVSLGTIYLTERLEEFSGSYIKTIAGYNAGPGRVGQWVKQFGDPSHKSIDPIDWIERIPFSETRDYVKKVLANMQVYRSRLGNPQTALQIRKDLYRGRKDAHKATRPLIASK